MSKAEFLAKFQTCVNTDHGCWRPEAIIWGIQVKMFLPKLFDCEKRISLLNETIISTLIAHICTFLYGFQSIAQDVLFMWTQTPVTIVFLSDSEMNLMPQWYMDPGKSSA